MAEPANWKDRLKAEVTAFQVRSNRHDAKANFFSEALSTKILKRYME